MNLYFLRRGPAAEPAARDPERADARPLTDAGRAQINAAAHALRDRRLKVDLILTSPLRRARQTAEILAHHLRVDLVEEPLLSPGFNAATVQLILARYPGARGILLVGHEPDFTGAIGALIGSSCVYLPPGGLARVKVKSQESGALEGTLIWLLPPVLMTPTAEAN